MKRWSKHDRELGMDRAITRRDFLNGVAVALGAAMLPIQSVADGRSFENYYPPALTGLRGNHEGSYEVAHALRDGTLWQQHPASINTGEMYDLAVVGGGISGLSAAYFYQRALGSKARILILENHDDFGGHAKRNEFRVANRTILGFGGTWSIDSPAPYSRVARQLIVDLGIDMTRWGRVFNSNLYPSLGMRSAVFFDKGSFGSDKLVPFFSEYDDDHTDARIWDAFLAAAPMSAKAKIDLRRLFTEKRDYMPGLSSAEKKARLARMSYADYLTNIANVDSQVVKFLQARPHSLYGVGIDAVPAQDAWGLHFPGFSGLGLSPEYGKGMNRDAMLHPEGGEAYFFHFPDGSATVARLLVRQLIPQALPGKSVDDIITSRCDYSMLDRGQSPVRIRLNSTVVRVNHQGDMQSAKAVNVSYVQGNKLYVVKAKHCVLACWNSVIPYLCPELPQQQKQAMNYAVKVPLLYTNVLLSNWNSWVKAGVNNVYCPGAYHSSVSLDMPVNIGDYKCPVNPNEPIVVHLTRTPCSPGLSAQSQHRAGRAELLSTTFRMFEREIRRQLGTMFSSHGFDPARDIRAITVNRWAHGYAYQYNSLFDPFWLEGGETPCERARKPFGLLAIANADADAYSYTDAAIDQAHRAVTEILS